MGTFRIKLQSISTITPASPFGAGNDRWGGFDSSSNALTSSSQIPGVLSQLTAPASVPYVVYAFDTLNDPVLQFNTGGGNIILDGVETSPIDFNGLPTGFVVTSALVKCVCIVPGGGPGVYQLFLRHGSIDESNSNAIVGAANNTINFPYDFSIPQTMLSIVSRGCGVRLHASTIVSGNGIKLWRLGIEGNYSIQSFSWTLPVTTNIKAGDQVIINNPVGKIPGLDAIKELHVQSTIAGVLHDNIVLAQDFIVQTPTQIIFYLPEFGNLATGSTVSLYAVGDGIQFSGSVLAGTLTITLVDGSGMYVFVPFKGTDTLYDRTTPGATKNYNIPDPFIKTGFIP